MKDIPVRHIHPTEKEPKFSGGFSIRNVQEMLGGKEMVQELHRHDFFFILVLKKGSGDHEIDFTPYKISNHSVFILRPGQVHQLKLKASSVGYLMNFSPDFYSRDQQLRKATSISFYQPDARQFDKILSVATNIFHEFVEKQSGYQDIILANLSILFIELTRGHSPNTSNSDTVYSQERLDRLFELLEENISQHKLVSEYAEMMSLSAYQLNAVTKTMLGKSCSDVINDYIVLESKRYLLATSNQVSQIAYHLGYDDVSYYIRFFKKHTGYTPEVFRKNFR